MRMVQITESKIQDISTMVEDMLHIGGKLMSCIEEMKEKEHEMYGERSGRNGNTMSMRDDSRYREYNEDRAMQDDPYQERRMYRRNYR